MAEHTMIEAIRMALGRALEDDPEVIDDVLDEPHHVDLRGVHVLAFESFDWVVLPGAADGRYALGDESCGYGDADVASLRETLADRDRPRAWLSWNAPAEVRGFEGARVGDARLDLATGGIFAFPATESGDLTSLDGRASVPRWGGYNETHDGAPVPPGVLEIHLDLVDEVVALAVHEQAGAAVEARGRLGDEAKVSAGEPIEHDARRRNLNRV